MITVVGIGPGGTEYLTPNARHAIEQAEVLVGGNAIWRHLAAILNRAAYWMLTYWGYWSG